MFRSINLDKGRSPCRGKEVIDYDCLPALFRGVWTIKPCQAPEGALPGKEVFRL